MSSNPSTALSPAAQKQAVLKDLLDRAKGSIAAVLPKHLTPDRILKVALVATSKSPMLMNCSPQSVLQSVMQAAQLGLEPGSALGGAYLVPYGNTCQLIVGYRGLIDLARRSGQIQSIEARVVRARDSFKIAYGLDPVLVHQPFMPITADEGGDGKDLDAGPLVAVYAIARLKDGAIQTEVMTRSQVDAIKKRSRSSSNGPWVTDYEEMARKTVVRRICKYLPLSTELAAALTLDERDEGNPEVSGLADVFEASAEEVEDGSGVRDAAGGAPATAEKPKTAEDLVKNEKAKKKNGTAQAELPTERQPGEEG